MAQNIKLKRSSVAGKVPTVAQLEAGELAINTADGKLYFERDDSTIQSIVTTNTLITGSLNLSGSITGSDVRIDQWGSVSASLSAIQSGASAVTLQDVTDNGSTTTNAITAPSFTGSLLGTASYASYAALATTASYALKAESVGELNQNVTIVGNLNVFGTSSFTYVTSSQLSVDDSFISVNIFEPAERFGGLKIGRAHV
jgi:hypothetical protein